MAKKNIISDFSALKGKVSFSEVTVDTVTAAGNSAKKTAIVKDKPKSSKENDGGLKVGQKVVLMDSDLRGRIVSLGRTVGIELEDGLMIQAAYGEFAVTCEEEISALKQSKVKHKKGVSSAKSASSTEAAGILTVDLHIEAIPGGRAVPRGQQLQFQMDTFKRVINENLRRRGLKISFIHGVGDGILKAAIRKELDEVLALRCSYSVGDPAVTVVTIK